MVIATKGNPLYSKQKKWAFKGVRASKSQISLRGHALYILLKNFTKLVSPIHLLHHLNLKCKRHAVKGAKDFNTDNIPLSHLPILHVDKQAIFDSKLHIINYIN